jgi:GNAT superfamily N-acetyltransferase
MTSETATSEPVVRNLREEDLETADRIFRLAFGTFIGLPDPLAFAGDADYVRSRFAVDPEAAFGAEIDGELVGTNFATNWGSVGFFGPLTIHPDVWDRGIGASLVAAVVDRFDAWGTRHAGLFTFAQSTKHVGLYQKFGFWPRALTALMSKPVGSGEVAGWTRFSEASDRDAAVAACRELTGEIYEGLDLAREIDAAASQSLGETVLVWEGERLAGLAVCHAGAVSEAGSGTCYVKFGGVRPGAGAAFERLLGACEAWAHEAGAARISAGMNLAREEAYRAMRSAGYRADMQGVAMHRPNEEGYNRPGIYAIDDWR